MTTLRELAQAVVDASDAFTGALGKQRAFPEALYKAYRKAERDSGFTEAECRAILAALNAERAQGWAAGHDEGINDRMSK